MKSKKCLACGLVNFASEELCKKCGSDLRNQKLSTACPSCTSDNTQSFQMAYQSGTTSGTLIGISERGGIGVAGGKSQSVLAKSLKPPTADGSLGEGIAYIFIMVVAFNVIGVALMVLIDPVLGIFISIALTIAVGIFGVIKGRRSKGENERNFKLAMDRWRRSWICLKCGGTWLVHQ